MHMICGGPWHQDPPGICVCCFYAPLAMINAEVRETGRAKLVRAAYPGQLSKWSSLARGHLSQVAKLGDMSWKLPSSPVPRGEDEAPLKNEATELTQ